MDVIGWPLAVKKSVSKVNKLEDILDDANYLSDYKNKKETSQLLMLSFFFLLMHEAYLFKRKCLLLT